MPERSTCRDIGQIAEKYYLTLGSVVQESATEYIAEKAWFLRLNPVNCFEEK